MNFILMFLSGGIEVAIAFELMRLPAKNQQALSQFLLPLQIVDFDAAAAIAYGSIRAFLEKQGTPIGSLDTLIAAHALSLPTTLITNNTKEFSRVRDLQLDNWVSWLNEFGRSLVKNIFALAHPNSLLNLQ